VRAYEAALARTGNRAERAFLRRGRESAGERAARQW